jgi:hypothetical protein
MAFLEAVGEAEAVKLCYNLLVVKGCIVEMVDDDSQCRPCEACTTAVKRLQLKGDWRGASGQSMQAQVKLN